MDVPLPHGPGPPAAPRETTPSVCPPAVLPGVPSSPATALAARIRQEEDIASFLTSLPPDARSCFLAGHRLDVKERDRRVASLDPAIRLQVGYRFSDEKVDFPEGVDQVLLDAWRALPSVCLPHTAHLATAVAPC